MHCGTELAASIPSRYTDGNVEKILSSRHTPFWGICVEATASAAGPDAISGT